MPYHCSTKGEVQYMYYIYDLCDSPICINVVTVSTTLDLMDTLLKIYTLLIKYWRKRTFGPYILELFLFWFLYFHFTTFSL